MTLESMIPQIRQLSNREKLALIEVTAQMLQKEQTTQETAMLPARDRAAEPSATQSVDEDNAADLSFEEWKERQFEQGRHKMAALIAELLSRPDPPREKMLTYGLFKGRLNFDEEDFKAAEWNPSDEELENAGLSVHR